MMPRPWENAQEFRPRSTSSSQREDPSAKDEKGKANSIRKDIPRPENDNVEKEKMTKTDPLSIKKRRPLKSDGQNSNFCAGNFASSERKESSANLILLDRKKILSLLLLI